MSKTGQILDSMDLMSAASVGDYGMVEHILRNNIEDVNSVNASGWTALMYASNYGHYNIIRLLIRYNCNVDQRDWQGRTALMLAATNGHTRSIDVLVNYGKANKTLLDLSKTSAYQYAKNCGHGSNKLIKSLLLKSNQSFPYELKGRSMSSFVEPQSQMSHSLGSESVPKEETPTSNPDIYNPYENTVFSNWKPIKSDVFKDFYNNGSIDSLASIGSSSPPESITLSSSQSSQASAISLPPHFTPKAKPTNRKTVIQMPTAMPKSLFHLLSRIDLIQYLDLFEANGIDFYHFLTLTDSDFQKLGISCFGHRHRMSIAQMRYHESLDINSAQESFFADFLLNERHKMGERIQELEQKLQELSTESAEEK